MTAPQFDPASSSLLVGERGLDELAAAAAGEAPRSPEAEREREQLARAGALVGGAPHPTLDGALRARRAPVVRLELQQGAMRAEGWADGFVAGLLLPREQGRQLHVVPTAFLPAALARVNELGPRPRPENAERHVLTAAELAGALATGHGLPDALGEVRRHWRVDARWPAVAGSPGVRHVEVLDSAGGLWLVIPDDGHVELWPSTPTTVWRQLSALLPRDEELDFDAL